MDSRPTPRQHTGGLRRPVSPRRYMMRRLGVLLVLAALVVAGVWGVGTLIGGSGTSGGDAADERRADADGTSGRDAVAGRASNDANRTGSTSAGRRDGARRGGGQGAAVAVESPPPSTGHEPSTPTTERERSTPTADDQAVVYIAGDSDAGTFGPYLQRLLADTGVTETVLDYKVSSGLARPDFFNWHEHLEATIPDVDPDIVVVTFGGNDAQGIANEAGEFIIEPVDVEPDEWRAEYGRRAGEIMDYLMGDGRTVIWVGIPNTASSARTERLRVQDQVVREQIRERRPGIIFVDTWTRFSGRDGNYAEYVIDPRDGQGKLVRHNDGFHLNETGAEILALDIAEVVRTDLRERGADI